MYIIYEDCQSVRFTPPELCPPLQAGVRVRVLEMPASSKCPLLSSVTGMPLCLFLPCFFFMFRQCVSPSSSNVIWVSSFSWDAALYLTVSRARLCSPPHCYTTLNCILKIQSVISFTDTTESNIGRYKTQGQLLIMFQGFKKSMWAN